MNQMKSFTSVLSKALSQAAGSDVLAKKAARAARVKTMWRESVDAVFLDHTNSVYIIREGEKKILIVYVDDSIFAAELNARREMIKLRIETKFGEHIDEFRILISRGRYKNNYPFREGTEAPTAQPRQVRRALAEDKLEEIDDACALIEDERMREALKRAMISDLECKNALDAEKI